MALTNCPECNHQVSTRAAACPQCGFPFTDCENDSLAEVQPSGPQRAVDPTKSSKSGPSGVESLVGTILIIVLVGAICVAVYKHSESQSGPATTTTKSTRDPAFRYVGPYGAVVGNDNFGRTTRLPAGTPLKPTGNRYVDPMSGPVAIYTVMDGELRGASFPIRDRDLEPK